jgi:hypothetical protein
MMTPSLAQLQALFQARLLTGDESVLDHLAGGGRFMGVYEHAYSGRLAEILAEDFPTLRRLLGDEEFDAMARAYVAAHPSSTRSVRWVGGHLADWLALTQEGAARPELAELAAFEWALGLAFDAEDGPVLCVEDLAELSPEGWPGLAFVFHPSLSVVTLAHDVVAYWRAVSEGQTDIAPPSLAEEPARVAVWRDAAELGVRYRPLGADEAAGLELMRAGGDFATLCEVLAERSGADTAAWNAAGLIRVWLEAGWLSAPVMDKTGVSLTPPPG